MRLFILLALSIVVVLFTLQNDDVAVVRFFQWQCESSLGLLLLITFALGILASFLASLPFRIRKHREISHQNKKIQELEKNFREKIESLKPPTP